MIKVCYVITTLGKGGAEKQLFELIYGIDKSIFSPSIISLSQGGYWKERIEGLDIPVFDLPRKKNKEISRLIKLTGLIRTISPDIVHTYMWSANTYGRIASIILNIPVIIASERNISQVGKDKKKYEIFIDQLLSFFTDKIICNSLSASKSLTKIYSIKKDKVILVHNGIDSTKYRLNKSLLYNSSEITIGIVGRLEYQKNHKLFLEAAKIILKNVKNIKLRFLIVGDGQLNTYLVKYSKTLGIYENIDFIGQTHNVNQFYKQMDIFVLTSHFEGLPNALMEAMASSIPVVAVDVGGIRELIHKNKTGFLCTPNSASDIADKVIFLIKNQKKGLMIGNKGRTYIEKNFDIKKMVTLTEYTYLKSVRI